MTTTLEFVHQTSFNMFVPCDLQTYKKLKQAYHLYTQHIRPWANRWERAQRRMPSNRYFTFHKTKHEVKDSWVFSPLYDIVQRQKRSWEASEPDKALKTTELFDHLYADYWKARKPVATPEEVQPLNLSLAQLEKLIMDLNAFIEQQRSSRQR